MRTDGFARHLGPAWTGIQAGDRALGGRKKIVAKDRSLACGFLTPVPWARDRWAHDQKEQGFGMAAQNATLGPTFRAGDHIVYPAHGVGRVTGVEKQKVAGIDLEVFVIQFDQDKMTLRVPTAKAKSCGMRPLASAQVVG